MAPCLCCATPVTPSSLMQALNCPAPDTYPLRDALRDASQRQLPTTTHVVRALSPPTAHLTSTLSHPLSYALAAPQDTNATPHRSRRPRFSRCFQRPVRPRVARDVRTACKKGPSEPSHLCNISHLYCTAPHPTVPWAVGYTHTRRPQAAPLSQLPPSAPSPPLSIQPFQSRPPSAQAIQPF
eukprot:scaffold46400_cov51-Phaeocystis_antarctica.AAC.4